MELDVKNLAFGSVGETESFNLMIEDFVLAEDLIIRDLKGQIGLTRLEDSILVTIKLNASLDVECDRCLTYFNLNLKPNFNREYFLGGRGQSAEDLIVNRQFKIDLTDLIREEIILAKPTKKICQKECAGICLNCGENLNKSKCKCKKMKTEL